MNQPFAASSGRCKAAAAMPKRMDLIRVAFLALAVPLTAAAQIQPAVQPGGDIPARATPAPVGPAGPPITPEEADVFTYERREVFIPMRDGVRLYAVLIIPRGAGKSPIMLDRTPYSAD